VTAVRPLPNRTPAFPICIFPAICIQKHSASYCFGSGSRRFRWGLSLFSFPPPPPFASHTSWLQLHAIRTGLEDEPSVPPLAHGNEQPIGNV